MNSNKKTISLPDLIEKKKILICCGSGGVGKTTASAALALYAATKGLKSLVLTIDPAKRLANALGVENIGYDEEEISPEEFEKAGITLKAPLFAMMLDTKHTFDSIILKYSSEERAQVILQNKVRKSILMLYIY